jgi:hypothetical protein
LLSAVRTNVSEAKLHKDIKAIGMNDCNNNSGDKSTRASMKRHAIRICIHLAAISSLLIASDARGQFWDKLTNPQITINLTHPPRLGLNLKKFAFGPTYGRCSDEIVDQLSSALIANNVEVVDRITLTSLLAQRQLSLGGGMDSQRATQVGKVLGPTALIFVQVSDCEVEHRKTHTERREEIRDDHKDNKGSGQKNDQQGKQQNNDRKDEKSEKNYRVIHTNHAISTVHLRGSLQTVDLATGRIFSATPIAQDFTLENQADERFPEFPPDRAVRQPAIANAAGMALTMFVNWNEQKRLYFFDDKTCNLSGAYSLLKGGDLPGTLHASIDNIETCKRLPNVKESTLAHAYYNVGLAYLLVNDPEHSMKYLEESAKLKGGDIVEQTIAETQNSVQLEAEMHQVVERTEQFEQSQSAGVTANPQIEPATAGQGSPPSVEERLRQLESLRDKGLISKQEYDEKRREILKDL